MEPWRRLDTATRREAGELLRTCCGASRWIERMLARRPFRSQDALLAAAREEWSTLGPADWREAFDHHPKIGDRGAVRQRVAATRHLSEQEQQGLTAASPDVLAALAEGNRTYEQKFGFIFIVCATGKNAEEILSILHARLHNEPDVELHIAAAEQAAITEIRLLGLQ